MPQLFPLYILTYLLHGEESCLKLTGFQLVKKFPAFYGTRRFITAFAIVRHLSQSWASSIQSIPPHPTSWRYILISSSHLCLGLPNGHFPSDFPTKILYTPLLPPYALLSLFSLLYWILHIRNGFWNRLRNETEILTSKYWWKIHVTKRYVTLLILIFFCCIGSVLALLTLVQNFSMITFNWRP